MILKNCIKKGKVIIVFSIFIICLISCGENVIEEKTEEIQEVEEIQGVQKIKNDMGKQPWVVNIEETTIINDNYRIATWTGEYLQLVYMSLEPGDNIDLELHNDHDQFIRIEKGKARILMGKTKDNLSFDKEVSDDWAILIPAGYWHEVRNIGNSELKLYTIYGPPEHPKGTINKTYSDAEEHHHNH